jgi:hypothetical protein
MPLPLILDENQRGRSLWNAIQTHSATSTFPLDVLRVGDSGCPASGTLDPELLEWAIRMGRIIVTKDVNTLIQYHNNLVAAGRATPGLWVMRDGFRIPEILDAIVLCSHVLEPGECASLCRYLPVI